MLAYDDIKEFIKIGDLVQFHTAIPGLAPAGIVEELNPRRIKLGPYIPKEQLMKDQKAPLVRTLISTKEIKAVFLLEPKEEEKDK